MLKTLKLGQSIVLSASSPAFLNFLNLVKEYAAFVKQAADAKIKYDAAKKADTEKMKNKDYQKDFWGQDDVYDSLDLLLSQQQKGTDMARKKLDEAWTEYKKDKSLKKIINIDGKKDLESKVQDATFQKMFQGDFVIPRF